jgi:hypothetical protein
MLQEISRLLDEVDTKTDDVTRKAKVSTESLRNLELVALRYLTIAQRMGLPEGVDAAITAITKLIVLIRQLQLTIGMLEMQLGPIGWAAYGASAFMTALSVTDLAGSFT